MTVEEPRKTLRDVPGHLPVYITVEDLVTDRKYDYMREVATAAHSPSCPIAPESFDITTGKSFGW
jgi:hypothetical protein